MLRVVTYQEILAERDHLRAELAAVREECAKIAGRYCEMARNAIRASNAAPPQANLCDCELSHNGMGMVGRECDCPAGAPPQPYCKVCGNVDCGYPACAFKP